MNDDDINDVLNALSVSVSTEGAVKAPDDLTEDNIMTKVLENMAETIAENMDLLKTAAEIAKASGDAEHIESYASLVKSNADMVKILTSIHMDREKMRQQKEIKEKEIAARKEIAAGKSSSKKENGPITQNNFLFSGPREAIFDLLGKKPEEREKALLKLQELNPPTIDV